jgi:hypothetical protein
MVSAGLEEIKQAVQRAFGSLSGDQLNIRPAPGKWSIAQCLDHLIVSNSTYIPAIERVLSGNNKPGWWQRINPFTGLIGRKGIDILRSKIKLKAPAIFKPSEQAIPADIVTRFATHQEEMKQYFDRLEQEHRQEELITIPAIQALSLKIVDMMKIIVEHERRHLEQARRVQRDYVDK